MPTVPYEQFPFCQGLNRGLSPVTASQRCINSYPEKNTGVNPKTPTALIGRAGVEVWATLPTSPVRGSLSTVNDLFAVAGTHFYRIDPITKAITDYGAITGSSGAGTFPCQIVTNGTQVLVMDSSVGKIFHADPVGPSVTYVHDGVSLEYMNGFFYALTPGTPGTTPSTIYQSDFLDGTTWPALDYVDISATPDTKTHLITSNNQMYIMGVNNIEVWSNAGTPGFILALSQVINQGLYSSIFGGFCVARAGNTIYWLGGSTERGSLQFYRLEGVNPVRVSNTGVEAILTDYDSGSGQVGGANSFSQLIAGHTFFVTNFPLATNYLGGTGATLVLDITTGEWHEQSYESGGIATQALPSCFASVMDSGGGAPLNLVGAFNSGKILLQDPQLLSDDGVAINFVNISPHVSNQGRWLPHNSLRLDCTNLGIAPQVSISDDGGRTFGTYKDFMLYSSGGTYGPQTWVIFSLGASMDRVYMTKINSAFSSKFRMAGVYLEVGDGGTQP